jgi:hypothetical protein
MTHPPQKNDAIEIHGAHGCMNRRDVLLAAVAGIAGLLRTSRAAAGPQALIQLLRQSPNRPLPDRCRRRAPASGRWTVI